MRYIYNIDIETDDDNFYRIVPDQYSKDLGACQLAIKADDIMLKRFLRRCKVADETTQPRSYRSLTYNEICSLIKGGKYKVYMFSNKYPKSQSELERLMKQ